MSAIRVAVTGASGKMAREVVDAICRDAGLDLVGATSRGAAPGDTLQRPDRATAVPLFADLEELLDQCHPQVVVDFTHAAAVPAMARGCIEHGVRPVIGTSGVPAAEVEAIADLCRERRVGGVLAANFALGAVLMMAMARLAAPHFDQAEIIELHHDQKADAPSGTALATAAAMGTARGRPFTRPETTRENLAGSRAASLEGVTIHSVRLAGLAAHQEVIFGGLGQTLTIRHDTMGRDCYMPGVLLAIKRSVELQELVVGLDSLLGLT